MSIDKTLVSGSVTMLLLKLLSEKDMYGYEMISTLRERSQNVFELKAGSLYPLLHNLEGKNIVASYEKEVLGKCTKVLSHNQRGGMQYWFRNKKMERICRCCSRRHVIGGVIYMEEYLKTLLEQIRCKKAHASIYHEIRGAHRRTGGRQYSRGHEQRRCFKSGAK